jgi:hypothetical protein
MYMPKPHNMYYDKTKVVITILKMLGGVTLFAGLLIAVYVWTVMGAAMLGVL